MRGVTLRVVGACLALVGCRSVELPEAPKPGAPGSIQGTVLFAQVGRAQLQPAAGAIVELLGGGASTTANADGYFQLGPILSAEGSLLFRFDSDRNGSVDHQRLMRLSDIGAAAGKTVALGQVVLGGNATLRGTALRRDLAQSPSGHAGTTVFVPEGPYTTYTGDNGAFVLENLPEGPLTVAFFRAGYESSTSQLQLRGKEVFSLSTVVLEPRPGVVSPVRVSGSVLLEGLNSFEGVSVTESVGQTVVQTDTDGFYSFTALAPGLYSFGFSKDGFVSAVLRNVLIDGTQVANRTVTLARGTSTRPDLDAGTPFDAGPMDAGAMDAGAMDAGPMDAGPMDAGPMDAGPMDAGPMDAGPMDAGPMDAGPMDAGAMDAGAMDAGAMDAGAMDAGPPWPVALVDALPAFVGLDASVQFSAQRSTGERPLSYRWSQDAGPTVVFPNNGTPLAATPTVRMPGTPSVLKLGLTVIDSLGRSSEPFDFTVSVAGARPLAVIAPGVPATVYLGQQVQLSSAGSSDPNGSGVVGYEWSVLPTSSGIAVQPQDGGATCELLMPASLSAPLLIQAQLVVTNGLGLRSLPATVSFTLTNTAAPTWTLDAGIPSSVNGGAVATLSALAAAPGIPAAQFSYLWSPAQSVDAGAQSWTLVDPTARSTSFIAPIIVGANQVLDFSVTATALTPGVTPSTRTASTFVVVQDRTAPVVMSTSVEPGNVGHPLGAWLDWSEPLRGSSIGTPNAFTVPATTPTLPNVVQRWHEGERITFAYQTPALEGTMVDVRGNTVYDTAPGPSNFGNASPIESFRYRVTWRWPEPFVSHSSTQDAVPSLVLEPLPKGRALAHVAARRDGQVVFYAPVDLESCSVACQLVPDSSPPLAHDGGQVLGPRGFFVAGAPYVALQTKDLQGTAGLAATRRDGGWVAIAEPPGTLFTDGTALYSPYADNGLKLARYDEVANTWGTADASVVSTSAEFPSDAGSSALAWGYATDLGQWYVLGRTVPAGDLRAFIRTTATAAWTTQGILSGGTANPVRDVRLAQYNGMGASLFAIFLRQSTRIEVDLFGNVNNGSTPVSTGGGGFDVLQEDSTIYLPVSVNGQLRLQYIRSGTGADFSPFVLGPPRMGTPTPSFNVDPACVADKPAIARHQLQFVLAWQERCAGGPSKAYVRLVR